MGERILTREDSKSFIRSNTEKLKLPPDFTVIGKGALAGFSQVKELTIPEGVHKIESHAFFTRSFKNTSNLEHLVIPASLTEFDIWAFFDCDMLKTVNVPEDFSERLALELFFFNPALMVNFGKKMLFAAKQKKIQQIMDETKGILTQGESMVLTVNDGILTIPSDYFGIVSSAFRGMNNKGVKKVIIPPSIRIIAPEAFSFLPELEEVIVLDGATHIDNYAFAKCKRLRSVALPDSIKHVGAGLFMDDEALRVIKLPARLEEISEEMFAGCKNLSKIGFGNEIKSVGAGAFTGCESLTSLMLPEKVETIGTSAFWECNGLQRLYLPPATKSINPSALCNCPQLNQLYMPRIISDALESKRIFGENTNPVIQWVDEYSERPEMEFDEKFEMPIPELPVNGGDAEIEKLVAQAEAEKTVNALPSGVSAQAAFQPQQPSSQPSESDTVRKLEESIAAMQQQIELLAKQNSATQAAAAAPALDTSIIQSLNDNLAAMRDKFDAVSSMQESIASVAKMQDRVEEIAEMQSNVQQKLEAVGDIQQSASELSGMKEKIDAISDIQEKVDAISENQANAEAISEIREKVDAISDIQEKVDAISDVQEKVSAISDIQEKVGAISDVQEKVGAISDIQEKVGVISDVKEKVGEISDTQADMNKRFAEMTVRPSENDTPVVNEELYQFDVRMALVPVQRGHYRPDDRVFTHEISKVIAGPRERSTELKQYTVIASRAFQESEGGERFAIPEGVRRIETQAFWNSPRLLGLELPHSLTEVEPDAFAGCSRLTDVFLSDDFPERLAAEYFLYRPEIKLHWPKKSFFSKEKIVTVAELLEKYEDILTAEKVKKLQVRSHILQIPEGYTIIAPDMARGIDIRESEPEHVLKTIFLPRSTRRIAARAFSNLETVMHIVLPNGVQIIDMNAFSGCNGPYRLVLPDTVTYIGPMAFAAPSRFEQIRVPKNIRYISEHAFANCDKLASLRIPMATKFIGESALAGCPMLSSLTIPKRFSEELPSILEGTVKINVRWTEDVREEYRSEPPASFMSIVAPDFPPTPEQRLFTAEMCREAGTFAERLSKMYQHPCIGPLALAEMANQTKFEIPLGVQRICSYAFGSNSRLLTLTIPKALNEFEFGAFFGCERVRDVTFPEEFDRYGAAVLFMRSPSILLTFGSARPIRVRQLLHECPWVFSAGDAAELDAIDGTMKVPNGYVVISSYVYHGMMGMTNLKRFLIPPSAKLIGYHAFVELKSLEEIICAEGLQAIEPEAFLDCPELKRIVLPSTLRFMGMHPFAGCPKLETVVLPKCFSHRKDELLRDHPSLNIQWCEDFAEDECPSIVKEYEELRSSAQVIDSSIFEELDPLSVPQHYERDADFTNPIEVSTDDDGQRAIEGEVYESIIQQDRPQIETVLEATVVEEETTEANPFMQAESDELIDESVEEVAELDGAEISDLADTISSDLSADVEHAVMTDESLSDLSAVDGAEAEEVIEAISEDTVSESGADVTLDEIAEQEPENLDNIKGSAALEDNATEQQLVATGIFSEADDVLETDELTHAKVSEALGKIGNQDSVSLDDIVSAISDGDAIYEKLAQPVPPIQEPVEMIAPVENEVPAEEADAPVETAEPEPETKEFSLEEIISAISEEDAAAAEHDEILKNEFSFVADSIFASPDSKRDVEKKVAPTESTDRLAEEQADAKPSEQSADTAILDEISEETVESDEAEKVDENSAEAMILEEISEEIEAVAEESEEIKAVADELFVAEETANDASEAVVLEEISEDTEAVAEESEEIKAVAEELFTTGESSALEAIREDADIESLSEAISEFDGVRMSEEETDSVSDDIAESTTAEAMEDTVVEAVIIEQPEEKPLEMADVMTAVADSLFVDEEPQVELEPEPSDPLMKLEEITEAPTDENAPKKEMNFLANSLFDDNSIPSLEIIDEPEVELPKPESDGSDVTLEVMENLADAIFTGEITNEPIIVERTGYEGGVPEDGKLTAKECKRFYHGEFVMEIPEGYREIRAGACAALEHLESLELPSTIEKIGNGAFSDCNALERLVIPVSVMEIAEDAFDSCDALTDVTLPRRFEKEAKVLFPNATVFTWLETAPPILGDGRFTAKLRAKLCDEDAENLEIPDGYLEIRAGACAGLENLKSVTLPSTLEKICAGAFSDCTALESVTIPESVTELSEDAFDGCTKLAHVTVSKSLEEAAKACFPNVILSLLED